MERVMRASLILTASIIALITLPQAPVSAQPASSSAPIRDAGDAASKAVGVASADTLGSYNAGAFVDNAARGDMYEIRAGQMAEVKAMSPEIKAFGARMVKAHTKTTEALKAALAQSGAKASIPDDLDARRKGLLENLRASSGAEFDRRYVAQQIAAHEEARDLMKGYAEHGDNPTLKAAAAKTLIVVDRHLRMLKKLPGGQAA
jgi:putative membrane protein